MNFGETRLRLLARVLEALLVVLGLELLQLGVERGLLLEQRVAPDVGFEDGVDGDGVVADDLQKL